MQGGRGAAGRYRCVWAALTVFQPHWVCPAHGCVLSSSTLLRLPAALYGACPALRVVPLFGYSTKARTVVPAFCVFPGLSGSGSQRLGALSTGAPRLFPPRPQRARPVRCLRFVFVLRSWPLAATLPAADVDHPESQGVFRQDPGRFAGWEGAASLGLSLPLSPPSASYFQWGWGGSSLEFLSPFVLRTAGGVFRPVNFSSLSHSLKNLPPTALRAFWPVPTLRNAAGSSPLRPLLLVEGAGVWGTFLPGVAFST